MSQTIRGGSRLVETDVPVAPDPEKLEVDASGFRDFFVIIRKAGRIREMGVFLEDVDMGEEVLLHESPVGLVFEGASEVFVEIEGFDF